MSKVQPAPLTAEEQNRGVTQYRIPYTRYSHPRSVTNPRGAERSWVRQRRTIPRRLNPTPVENVSVDTNQHERVVRSTIYRSEERGDTPVYQVLSPEQS